MAQVNLGRVVGYSAYEIAVQNGFIGTEAEWLASLQGADGTDGAPGQDGQDGAPGAAATISVGTVSTGSAGSSASVVNVGTTSAAVLDFVIPAGPQGPAGSYTAGNNITISEGTISASFTESDPIFGASAASSITASDISAWNAKQDALTAGANITISGNEISATFTESEPLFSGSAASSITASDISAWNAKQDALTAGSGITISGNVISATTSGSSYEGWEDDCFVYTQSGGTAGWHNEYDNGHIYSYIRDNDTVFAYYGMNITNAVYNSCQISNSNSRIVYLTIDTTTTIDDLTYGSWSPSDELPIIASGDAGKVLTVNSGETGVEWANPTFTFTESDPVFSASPAASITASDISNWNGIVGVPSASSASEGDVLTVDRGGDAVWAAPSSVDTFSELTAEEIYAGNPEPATPEIDDEYYTLHMYDSVIEGTDYVYNDSDEWEEARKFELGTGGLTFTNGSVVGDLGMDDTTGAILWNGDEIAMKNDIISVPTYSYGNVGQVLGVEELGNRGMRAPAEFGLAWVTPSAGATYVEGTGIAIDDRGNEISITDISVEVENVGIDKTTKEYSAPTNGETIVFTKYENEWVDTGEVDENEDPIYDWNQTEYDYATYGVGGMYQSFDNTSISETSGINVDSNAITWDRSWLEEGEATTEKYAEYVWCPDYIQLKDQTTGDIYQLEISNGQIVLTNVSQSL